MKIASPKNGGFPARVAGPWAMFLALILGACGSNMYLEQKKMIESRSAELPYVKNGYVDLDTVTTAQMTTYGGGSFQPPRPTDNFPHVWGEDPTRPQQSFQTVAAATIEQPRQYYEPVRQNTASRSKLAVMEMEDQSGRLGREVAARGTDYLRATLNATRAFIVIDKSRQAEALMRVISNEKKESYKECYDQACQIPLGQALAADTILRTQITRIATFCTLSSELVDLEKEATIGGGLSKFDCTEDGLSMAIEKLVPQLITGN